MKIHAFVRIPTRDLQAWLLIKRAIIRFRRGAHDRAAMAWWFLEVGGGPLVSAAAVCEDKVSASAPPQREFGSFGGDQFSITTDGYLLRAGRDNGARCLAIGPASLDVRGGGRCGEDLYGRVL